MVLQVARCWLCVAWCLSADVVCLLFGVCNALVVVGCMVFVWCGFVMCADVCCLLFGTGRVLFIVYC